MILGTARRRRIEAICEAALARDGTDRNAFLNRECAGDESLRRDVEALLAHAATSDRFLSTPIGALAAGVMTTTWIGRRFGTYEVISAIGVGGMGEAYRARDHRLGRDVAIKVLPASFAADRERLARFEREARVLAALNNPHIASIYGLEDVDGAAVLVLEFVSGETLGDRIVRGPIAIRDVIPIAQQIAEALEAAHDKGIIHRDLKPSNIALTTDGAVKVLDFGLAKANVATAAEPSQSPTFTLTARDGVLLGTAPYMSPEQARGQTVDKRTDIWAFGCVLYEMLTGRMAFAGATTSDHIAAILEREPDWSVLPAQMPSHIQQALRGCLQKDVQHRWHDIGDVRLLLQASISLSPTVVGVGRRIAFAWVLAGTLLGAGIGAFTVGRPLRSNITATAVVTRSTVAAAPGTLINGGLALSPDGQTAVFVGIANDRTQLYARTMNQAVAKPILGTEGGSNPFFSPDGQWVAFAQDRKIKKVAVTGGAPQTVCDAIQFVSGAWGDDNRIVFASTSRSGLSWVSADGGTPQILTTPNRGEREKTHRSIDVLPGGQALLMTVGTSDITTFDDARIEVLSVATGERKVLISGGMRPLYVPTGHVVYARSGSLFAVPFDLTRLQVTGPPVTVVEDVATYPDIGYASFAVSRNGSLLYLSAVSAETRTLTWVDQNGRTEVIGDLHRPFEFPRLSPDGRRIAVTMDRATAEIWLYDLERTTFTRLVTGWDNLQPLWSPDGARIVFNSNRGTLGGRTLFWQAADGTTAPQPLTADERADQFADAWSPDGRFLLFSQVRPGGSSGLWMWASDSREARPLQDMSGSQRAARLSPDGRWIAYESDQSGRSEVYVRAFPGPSRTWQVSLEGGSVPVWAPTGRELFFRNGASIFAANVVMTPEFAAAKPKRLFDVPRWWAVRPAFDVARDGRFLILQRDEVQLRTEFTLVQNWFDELNRLVPSKATR